MIINLLFKGNMATPFVQPQGWVSKLKQIIIEK